MVTSDDVRKTLSTDEINVLLRAYEVLNEYDRHWDTMAWTMGSILIPVSLAILAAAVTTLSKIPILVLSTLATVSIIILISWWFYFYRMNVFQWQIRPKIEIIADLLGNNFTNMNQLIMNSITKNTLIRDLIVNPSLRGLLLANPLTQKPEIHWHLGVRTLNTLIIVIMAIAWGSLIILRILNV